MRGIAKGVAPGFVAGWLLALALSMACAPPREHDLVPGLGSGPPVADTGVDADGPADDPADDASEDATDGDMDEDDSGTASSGAATGSGTDGSDSSGTGVACPPAQEGCACGVDGACDGGLTCVEGVCEPCDGCDTGAVGEDTGREVDPCAAAMFGDGPYCGESIGGTAETLYLCAGGQTTATSACDFGCAQCDAFVADVCKSFVGQSDADACG